MRKPRLGVPSAQRLWREHKTFNLGYRQFSAKQESPGFSHGECQIVGTKLLSGVSVKSNKSVKVVKKDVGFVATKWTDDEVKILQKMSANGASSAEISEKLNRSIKAIESKCRKLKQSKLWKELG